MPFVPFPTKKPTGGEYTVIVWLLSIVFIILGVIAPVVAIRAPAEHVTAVLLAKRGVVCISIGGGIQVIYGLYRRFVD